MLSVCIPVFNCDITDLVRGLLQQLNASQIEFEVLVLDDCSNENYKKANHVLANEPCVFYLELGQNIGRSAIRNLLATKAKYDKLLFMDCDSKLVSENFIKKYIAEIDDNPQVICGGRLYAQKPTKAKLLLRWKYGVNRECPTAKERNKNPYHSFMTNNFLVNKEVFKIIKFDERLKGYGHEDSLFGYFLRAEKLSIKHIDNQLVHSYNETSDEFLRKTKQGIRNLLFIHSEIVSDGRFTKMNKLLTTYQKYKKMKLLMKLVSYPVLSILAFLFRLGIVYLWLFDIYKLLYFFQTTNPKRKLLR